MKKVIFAVCISLLPVAAVAAALTSSRTPATAVHVEPDVASPAMVGPHRGFIYGRVTATDGATYEGRIRFGGAEEALWTHYFNGKKRGNPWLAIANSHGRDRSHGRNMDRPVMFRFGDIDRIEARGRALTLTLRNGTVHHLDRYEADDFADGVRVWDRRGVVDLGERKVRRIEFLPTPELSEPTPPLYGTVQTASASFTGLIQWDRTESLAEDVIRAGEDGPRRIRLGDVRAVVRDASGERLETHGGEAIPLPGKGREKNRGLYVDDVRYGRVLVSWDALRRVDFTPADVVRARTDFSLGEALRGEVTTLSGRVLSGRLVYDLDESETIETLDAPADGVDYTIPFALVSWITPGGSAAARVALVSGEELVLEPAGDLGASNAGLLVFPDSGAAADYVPWRDIKRIDLTPHERAR